LAAQAFGPKSARHCVSLSFLGLLYTILWWVWYLRFLGEGCIYFNVYIGMVIMSSGFENIYC